MDELQEKQKKKKEAQHLAWRKWYYSPKGAAYQLKRKLTQQEEPNDQVIKSAEQL